MVWQQLALAFFLIVLSPNALASQEWRWDEQPLDYPQLYRSFSSAAIDAFWQAGLKATFILEIKAQSEETLVIYSKNPYRDERRMIFVCMLCKKLAAGHFQVPKEFLHNVDNDLRKQDTLILNHFTPAMVKTPVDSKILGFKQVLANFLQDWISGAPHFTEPSGKFKSFLQLFLHQNWELFDLDNSVFNLERKKGSKNTETLADYFYFHHFYDAFFALVGSQEGFDALEHLTISHIPYRHFPIELSGFSGLKRLALNNVDLETLDNVALVLLSLENLTNLSLRQNSIHTVLPLAGCAQIENLDLSFNPIFNVDALQNQINLKTVNITGTYVQTLPDGLNGKVAGFQNSQSRFKELRERFVHDIGAQVDVVAMAVECVKACGKPELLSVLRRPEVHLSLGIKGVLFQAGAGRIMQQNFKNLRGMKAQIESKSQENAQCDLRIIEALQQVFEVYQSFFEVVDRHDYPIMRGVKNGEIPEEKQAFLNLLISKATLKTPGDPKTYFVPLSLAYEMASLSYKMCHQFPEPYSLGDFIVDDAQRTFACNSFVGFDYMSEAPFQKLTPFQRHLGFFLFTLLGGQQAYPASFMIELPQVRLHSYKDIKKNKKPKDLSSSVEYVEGLTKANQEFEQTPEVSPKASNETFDFMHGAGRKRLSLGNNTESNFVGFNSIMKEATVYVAVRDHLPAQSLPEYLGQHPQWDKVNFSEYVMLVLSFLVQDRWDLHLNDFKITRDGVIVYDGDLKESDAGEKTLVNPLLLLPLMDQEIPEDLQALYKYIDPTVIVARLLAECKEQRQQYHDMLKASDVSPEFVGRVLGGFQADYVTKLLASLKAVKAFFTQDPQMPKTLNQLFQALNPETYQAYQTALQKPSVLEAVTEIESQDLSGDSKRNDALLSLDQAVVKFIDVFFEMQPSDLELVAFLQEISVHFWDQGCQNIPKFNVENTWKRMQLWGVAQKAKELVFAYHVGLAKYLPRIELGRGQVLQRGLLTVLEIEGSKCVEPLKKRGFDLEENIVKRFPNLVTLRLANVGLDDGDDLKKLCELEKLRHLLLPGNKIQKIDFVIAGCPWETLDLAENPLGSPNNDMALMSASKVRVLNLNTNSPGFIKTLHFSRGIRNVEELYLQCAFHESFREKVWPVPNSLMHIDVSGNKLKKTLRIKYGPEPLNIVKENSRNIVFEKMSE